MKYLEPCDHRNSSSGSFPVDFGIVVAENTTRTFSV